MSPEVRSLFGLPEFGERTLYRMVERLGENHLQIVCEIQNRLLEIYDFSQTNINIDWSSVNFYGTQSTLGKYGYSRDHLPNKLMLSFGLTGIAYPFNIIFGFTVMPGNVNDMSHFQSTYSQVADKLSPDSLFIFDKGANFEKNLILIIDHGHDYLMAKCINSSDDQILADFWNRNPECLDPTLGLYRIKVVKPKEVNYIFF